MISILDQVARTIAPTQYTRFHPSTPTEFFALRLAQRLGDPAAARHYVELAERYSISKLLLAYHHSDGGTNAAVSFHAELKKLEDRSPREIKDRRLISIRIERRAIAIAILSGEHLECTPIVRQLSSNRNKAE